MEKTQNSIHFTQNDCHQLFEISEAITEVCRNASKCCSLSRTFYWTLLCMQDTICRLDDTVLTDVAEIINEYDCLTYDGLTNASKQIDAFYDYVKSEFSTT